MGKNNLKLINWQKPMLKVLYALIPVALASIYFFGWQVLITYLTVFVFGFFSEYIFARYYKEPVSSSVFVSCSLFALSLPPTLPLWMSAIGIIFGIIFGKMVFGGFGKNIFNPAIVGRAFLYVTFPAFMTGLWIKPAAGLMKGLSYFKLDTLTSATPLHILLTDNIPLRDLLVGNTAGSIGETSAIIIFICGLYLIIKKTANYRIVLSGFITFILFQTVFYITKITGGIDPLSALLSGGFLLGIFFMATDPVSASKTRPGQWIYGSLIGSLTVLIRTFSVWPEGMMFAILLANMFAPIIDYSINSLKKAGS